MLRGGGSSTVSWERAVVLQQNLMLLRAEEQRAARELRGTGSRGLRDTSLAVKQPTLSNGARMRHLNLQ